MKRTLPGATLEDSKLEEEEVIKYIQKEENSNSEKKNSIQSIILQHKKTRAVD